MTKRNILVVGGSSGIGFALVETLLAQGHEVYTWARQERQLAALPGVHFQSVDVLKDELPVDSLPDVLDGLAYCPGSINLKPFRSLKEADFRSDYEINVLGAVRCLQAVERRFKKSEQAAVVLFSTVAVQRGLSFHASIAAAKGAIEGLTRSLAAEWAPRVRVNAIAPSLTDTPLAEKLLSSEDKRKASADRHPLKRVGTPEDIAELADYLLSPKAGFITGQVLGVDGGMSVI
jgi:NAD(P)-dependent dehydrogenase (short-subunit alcohol dehydrogenase family)